MNDDISIAIDDNGDGILAHDVNFISVFESTDLFGIQSDGLLGLSPRKANSGGNLTVHLLVDELKNDGRIDKAMFAFDLRSVSNPSYESKVTFGGYDMAVAQERATVFRDFDDDGLAFIHWMTQDSEQHWQTRLFFAEAVMPDGTI